MAASGKKTVKKGSMALYVSLLILVILAMVLLKNCNRFQATVSEEPTDELVIAIEYSPLSFYTYNDTLGGFSYDLLRLIEKHAGVKFNFQPMVTLATSLENLNSGKFKMVCADMPVTKENKQKYVFTDPIYLDRQVLVQLCDKAGNAPVKSQLDLAGKTVWIVKDSYMQPRLANLSHEIGDTIYVKTEDEYGPEQLFLQVVSGEVEFAVMNERVAKKMAENYPQVDVSTGIGFSQFHSWAIKQGDETFCDSINAWLKDIRQTPEYRDLYYRYFSE